MATGWTVWGSNAGGDEIFCTRPDRPCRPPSLLNNGYWVIHGDKQPAFGVDHPQLSSAEVKEREDLYLFSTSGHPLPVLR